MITGFWSKTLDFGAHSCFWLHFPCHASSVDPIAGNLRAAPGKEVHLNWDIVHLHAFTCIPNHTFFKATFWPRGFKGRICGKCHDAIPV